MGNRWELGVQAVQNAARDMFKQIGFLIHLYFNGLIQCHIIHRVLKMVRLLRFARICFDVQVHPEFRPYDLFFFETSVKGEELHAFK